MPVLTFGNKTGGGSIDHGQYEIRSDNYRLCDMAVWGFRSCAAGILANFNLSLSNFFSTKEDVDSLLKFLGSNTPAHDHNPKEWYFLLNPNQQSMFKELVKHPKIKLIDTYKKKPYSGTPVFLYRLSLERDFDGLKGN